MTKITFEKLKENCVREFCSKNTRNNHGSIGCVNSNANSNLAIAQLVEFKNTGKFKNPHKLIKEVEDDCVSVIERVDIRNLTPLIQLCPDSVPNWIKNGNFTLDFDADGWTFFKN